MTLLRSLAWGPCTNAREMVFGPDADLRRVFAWARENLARFPSERALVDVIERTPERLGSLTEGPALLVRAADALGFVLRNPRISGCTQLIL